MQRYICNIRKIRKNELCDELSPSIFFSPQKIESKIHRRIKVKLKVNFWSYSLIIKHIHIYLYLKFILFGNIISNTNLLSK